MMEAPTRESIITLSVIAWLMSTAILTGGALLTALAGNVNELPRNRGIEFREATGLAIRPTDDLI
jgi:hypothetical protein